MTDEERKQLDNLEKNLNIVLQALQGQAAEAEKHHEAFIVEIHRTEGGLRLIQTIRAAASPVASLAQIEEKKP